MALQLGAQVKLHRQFRRSYSPGQLMTLETNPGRQGPDTSDGQQSLFPLASQISFFFLFSFFFSSSCPYIEVKVTPSCRRF